MVAAGIAFFGALLGIGSLLILKRWETTHNHIFFSDIRATLDRQALWLKRVLFTASRNVGSLPPFFIILLQQVVQKGAIAFGHLAHWLGRRSHDLADLVSHKYKFERRETRSEFLKKVIEHPMRNAPRPSMTSPIQVVDEPLVADLDTQELVSTTALEYVASEPIPAPHLHTEAPVQGNTYVDGIKRSVSRAKKIPAFVGGTLETAVKKVRRKKKSSKTLKPAHVESEHTPLGTEE